MSTANIAYVSQQGSLAIVEIADFSLIGLVCVLSIFYKGINRSKIGFIYLLTFCITHIVGSACYLSYELQNSSVGYETAYAITSFISAGPLLMASLAFSQYTKSTATNRGASAVVLTILQVLPLAASVIGIAGGAQYGFNAGTTVGTGAIRHLDSQDAQYATTYGGTALTEQIASNPYTVNYVTGGGAIAPNRDQGYKLLQTASIIYLFTAAALVVVSAINVSFVKSLRTLAITVSMPFLVIRVIYDVLAAFSDVGTQYQFNLPTYGIQVFMRFIMEHAIVILYLFTGMGSLYDHSDDAGSGEEEQDSTGSPYDESRKGSISPVNQSRPRTTERRPQ